MSKKINRILLDGVEYTSSVQGIHDIVLNYALDDESKTVLYSTTSEIVMKFGAFELIRDKIFTGDGCENKIVVTLILGCCGNEGLTFEINYRTILDYCPANCEVTTRLQERTPDQVAYDCLLNSIYWQDAPGQPSWLAHLATYPIPKFEYCAEPKGLSPILLTIISAVLTVVASGIASSGGLTALAGAAIVAGAIPAILALVKFGDCGKKHPSVPMQAIIDYSMLRCGLTFESNTIFTLAPYSDLHLIQCQYVEGEDSPPDWVPDNAANLNFIQIVDDLEPVFNSEFRIRGNKFILERKDELLRNLPLIGDIDALYLAGCSQNPPCYTYIKDRPCAIARFEYTSDAIDTGGNEVANLVYSDVVEWNDPPRDNAKGQCQIVNDFSAMNYVGMGAQTINDDIDPSSLLGKWYLKQGVSSQLKLVIYNPGTDITDAKPLGHNSDPISNKANYPLWYDEKLPEAELYKNFHFISDPRLQPCPVEAEDFEFAPENFCELVTLIRTNGTDVRVQTAFGDMKPDEVDINFGNQTLTLKGLKTFYVAPL